jgi:chromosomal replication initiator protein
VAKDDKEIVSRVSAVLATQLGSDCFDLWFASRTSLAWNGDRLQVFATDVFTLDRLRNKLRGSIESACRQITGSADVDFRLVPGPASGVADRPVPSKRNAVALSNSVDETTAVEQAGQAEVSPGTDAPSPTPSPLAKIPRVTKKPAATLPAATNRTAKTPAGKTPAATNRAAKTPAAKTPAAKMPAAKTPAAKMPVAKAPVAKAPVAKTPAVKTPAATSRAAQTPDRKSRGKTRPLFDELAEPTRETESYPPSSGRRRSTHSPAKAARHPAATVSAKQSPAKGVAAKLTATGDLSAKTGAARNAPSRKPLPYARPHNVAPPVYPNASLGSDSARDAAPPPSVGATSAEPPKRPAIPPSGTLPARQPAHWSQVVAGPCNQLALTAVQSVARQPGSVSPLYLYGPSGSGKSLLVDCLLQDSRRRFPGRRAVMLSAEQFTSQFVEALKGTGLPSFRRKYRDVDLLILDDIHFFAGKKATLIELQSTLDMLQRGGRQLVLTADRPPQEIAGLGKELGNRLCGGLVCRLEPPDAETRMGILRHHCQQRGVQAPGAVLDLIVDGVQGDARLLSGALWRLQAASQAWARPITRELAEGTLADLLRVSRRVIRLPDIEQAVCEAFGLDSRSLQSDGKQRAVSQPRMLAMWLARKYTRSALSEIGQYFGRRSHTSVIAANRKIDQLMDSDAPMPRSGGAQAAFLQAARRVDLMLRTGS